jgi:hypothetical protein
VAKSGVFDETSSRRRRVIVTVRIWTDRVAQLDTHRTATFARALTLARYNWPLYAVAAAGMLIGSAVSCISDWPVPVRLIGGLVAISAAWLAFASFGAFHAMFDRSNLLSGEWLLKTISNSPRRWVQLSVCLEETTLPMGELFPDAEGTSLDLFDSEVMTEPAVTRARQSSNKPDAIAVSPDALKVQDKWADLVVVTLAAHEVRDGFLREHLFRELHRITASNGAIVVVEHLRNIAALLAFGPGLFHFYPRNEWLRLGDLARLELQREQSITPFVHVFVFSPREASTPDGNSAV